MRIRNWSLAAVAATFGAAALALAGCTSGPGAGTSGSAQPPATPSAAAQSSPSASGSRAGQPTSHARSKSSPISLVVLHDPGRVTGTLAGPCVARDSGRLPDRHCTPGGIDPAVTQANIQSTICVSGYTSRVRPPEAQTEAFKFDEAYPAYGLASGTQSELDHLVPLELGGDNAAANLWPEIGSLPNPKDAIENGLNQAVCDGRISLAAAQRAIARNWETAESRLGIGPPYRPPAPVPTRPTSVLSCRASVSNSSPADYTTVYIYVHTAGGASVTTVAHYKTSDNDKSTTANAAGQATIGYYISGATPGYTVYVDVTASASGKTAHCSTSFTPVQ